MLLDKYVSSREEGNKQFTMQRQAFELRICFLLHVALGIFRVDILDGLEFD